MTVFEFVLVVVSPNENPPPNEPKSWLFKLNDPPPFKFEGAEEIEEVEEDEEEEEEEEEEDEDVVVEDAEGFPLIFPLDEPPVDEKLPLEPPLEDAPFEKLV